MKHTKINYENGGDFPEAYDALAADYKPQTAIEGFLIRQIADSVCRQTRYGRAEAGFFDRRATQVKELMPDGCENLPKQEIENIILGGIILQDSRDYGSPLTRAARIGAMADKRFMDAFKGLEQFRREREKRAVDDREKKPVQRESRETAA